MILLRNGLVVDPASGLEAVRDIVIDNGIITDISEHIDVSEANDVTEYDCTGLIIGPGLVDIHVHFRDPGFTYKEDIHTGSVAAARGGVTSVVLMANTKPVVDNIETLEYVINKGKETNINVYTCVSITKSLAGKELNDFAELKAHGAVGFTDDGIPILDEAMVRAAMNEAVKNDTILSFHEENPEYIENNGVNRGKASQHFGIGGSDRQAEIDMVARDIRLALETGAKVNFQHISTKEAVELIREAKKSPNGSNIYAEATPHHIALTEEDTITHGTLAKMNPPLRTAEDREAIICGLQDGTIDFIATDHAPHSADEKNLAIIDAPSGIIGLETSLKVSYNALIRTRRMSLLQLFCKLSKKPAEIYGINAGEVAIGRQADLVVFDSEKIHNHTEFCSKSSNSPFINDTITGDVVMTICCGKVIFEDFAK